MIEFIEDQSPGQLLMTTPEEQTEMKALRLFKPYGQSLIHYLPHEMGAHLAEILEWNATRYEALSERGHTRLKERKEAGICVPAESPSESTTSAHAA